MRIKRRDRILKITKLLQLDNGSTELLIWMYDNQEEGLINLEARLLEYITLKGISINDLYIAYHKLIVDGYIKVCNHEVQVLLCSEAYMNHFVYKTLKKRSYAKNPIAEQESISTLFNRGIKEIYQLIASKVLKPEDLTMPKSVKFSIQGIKIPVALRPYLTSELLGYDVLNGEVPDNFKYFYFDDKVQKEHMVSIEEERRSLTKEDKRTLIALLYMCKGNTIKNFSVNALVQTLNNNLGKGFSKTTVNDAIKKLKKLWFISTEEDEEGFTSLKIHNYTESFGKGKSYTVVPMCVLKKAFKKLHAGSIKAFFHFIFLLNNGENASKETEQGQDKAIYFKVASLSTETDEQKQKYRNTKQWLKRRSPKEIQNVILSMYSEDQDQYTSLAEFFDFNLLENGTTLQVRIRKQYYIKKKTVTEGLEIDPIIRYSRKARVINEVIQETKINVAEDEVRSFIKTFRKTGRKTIKVILEYVAERMQKVKIENLGGYIATIYKCYKAKTFKKTGEYAFGG